MHAPVAPDVYFPIEIVSREYAGHVLLAVELALRGRTAVVGHKGAVAAVMRAAERPGLLFYKNDNLRSWADPRHATVGLDPEAGISYGDYADFFKGRKVVSATSPSRAQFCFGPDDHGFLVTRFPDLAQRIHLTGAPRVSLWGAEGDVFYADDRDRILAHYGRVILFTSSGGFVHERYLKLRGQDSRTQWAAPGPANHFLSLVRSTAEQSDAPVVVRPHPSDSWRAWQEAVRDVPNLFVESVFDLSAWTRAAHAVVHPGTSTAAIESVCAGVPAISTSSNIHPSFITDRLSYVAEDAQDLVRILRLAQRGELATLPSDESRTLLERKLLHPLEGATQRIADAIDAAVPFSGPTSVSLKSRGRPARLLRRREPEMPLGRPHVRPYKRDDIHVSRVKRDVERAIAILRRPGEVQVHELSPNCFVITT